MLADYFVQKILFISLMSKLSPQDSFFDFSDYGRPFGKLIAQQLQHTVFTPIHVTLLFGISGLLAIACIWSNHYNWAAVFIVLKSIIDAADGELARIRQKPSYTGRYLDSIFDIILNLFFFLIICYVSTTSLWVALIAFFCIQLQGTLYNYYYLILRHNSAGGDKTSQIFEHQAPTALPGETQKTVNFMHRIYTIVYGLFDKIIHKLDPNAYQSNYFARWFMSFVSLYGLGFQLLIMAMLLVFNVPDWVAPFFILYTLLLVFMICIRKIGFK